MAQLMLEFWAVIYAGGPLMLALFALAVGIYWLAIDTLRALFGSEFSRQALSVQITSDAQRQLFENEKLLFFSNRKALLQTLVTAAPLLGLLGTVMGMLATFQGLNASSGNTVDLIAAGISEAMITTETGLLIAIPASFILMAISSRMQAIQQVLETSCGISQQAEQVQAPV